MEKGDHYTKDVINVVRAKETVRQQSQGEEHKINPTNLREHPEDAVCGVNGMG